MEKETLLTGFKNLLGEPGANGYFGDTGVTARTLDAYVDALLPTIASDDAVNDSFYQSQLGVIKAMGGQMRYEQSEFVKNYKPKGGEPPVPSPQPNPTPVDHGNDDLLKRLEAIEKEREQFKKTSFEKSLREKVINKAGSLNVSNKALWEDVAGMIPITDGMDESKLEEETKRLYESKLKAYNGDGAIPYRGVGGGGGCDSSSKALDEFFAKKAQEGKFPSNSKNN